MKYTSIINCQVCNKQGAIEIDESISVDTVLNHKLINGFTRCPAVNQDWKVMCEECNMRSKALLEAQKLERGNFLKGAK